MKDNILKLYQNKKVLILGLGLNQGGLGATKFFAKAKAKVKVTDIKTARELKPSLSELTKFKNIEYTLGEHKYEDIDWADIIIRNPALKPNNPFRQYAEKKGKRVEMDMGILLDFLKPAQIIGITGTKGKSTTSSLIYEVLKNAGKKVFYGGNIGKSPLDIIEHLDEETVLVLEISSFQLEAFAKHKVSPKYAVITNIFEDHLNYYSNMNEYIESKRIITKFQTKDAYLFISEGDEITNSQDFLQGLKANILIYSSSDLPKEFKPLLKGQHNLMNMAAALEVSKLFEINESAVLNTLKNFTGVEFRFQLIYNQNGIKIYNDTTATNPGAAIASIKSLPSCILITGGQNANMAYQTMADVIDKNVKAVYFLEGDATEEIKRDIKHKSIFRSTYNNLEKLLLDLKLEAKEGDTILFSPGAKSFNLFANEFDRGRKFNEAVKKVFS